DEHAAVGERPALDERTHRLGVGVDLVQAPELREERVLVGVDEHRLDERPLAVARRVGNRRLLGRGRVSGADEGEREAQRRDPVRHGGSSFAGPGRLARVVASRQELRASTPTGVEARDPSRDMYLGESADVSPGGTQSVATEVYIY